MGLITNNVDKGYILRILKDADITASLREMKINSIFNSELLVMDSWSSRFYENLRPIEREVRKDLYDKYRFDSGVSFIYDKDFEDLSSLSEALISLVGPNPQWLDIVIVGKKLNLKFEDDETGVWSKQREKCIDAIVKYFDEY